MSFQFLFRAQNPADGGAHGGWNVRLCGIAVSVDECTIVLGIPGHKIDEGLEVSTSAALYLDNLAGLLQGFHLTEFCIELHDIYLLDAVFEEAVDGGVEMAEVFTEIPNVG